jgi:integrase
MSAKEPSAKLRMPQPGDPRTTRYPTKFAALTYRVNAKGCARLGKNPRAKLGPDEKTFQAHVKGEWVAAPRGLSEKEAREWKVQEEAKLASGERVRSKVKRTFADVAELWFETKRARETTLNCYRSRYRVHLLPRWGERDITTIDEDDIAALIADIDRGGYSESLRNNCMNVVNGIFRYAADRRRRWIARDPARELTAEERKGGRKRKEMAWFERDEIAPFLDCVRVTKRGVATTDTLRTLFFVAIFTGLRPSELLALRFQDIDSRNGIVRVRWQLGRRGKLVSLKTENSERDVVLADDVLTAILALRRNMTASQLAEPHDFIFQRKDFGARGRLQGGPLNYGVLHRAFGCARERAGLSPRLKPHSCRHTFASIMILDAKVNVVFLSRQLGHSKVSTTLDTYSHWWDRVNYADETRAALARALVNTGLAAHVDTNSGHVPITDEENRPFSGSF